MPSYWFERHEEVVEADGRYTVNPRQATITMVVDGSPSVLFYLAGSRLEGCTFAFHLSRHQLANAVAAMKRAKLTRFLRAAASATLKNLPELRRATLETDLRLLAIKGARRKRSAGGSLGRGR